jgi:hypothetical protein
MILDAIVRPDRRGYSTLRVHRIGFCDLCLGEYGDASGLGQIQRRAQSGDAASDDDVVGIELLHESTVTEARNLFADMESRAFARNSKKSEPEVHFSRLGDADE